MLNNPGLYVNKRRNLISSAGTHVSRVSGRKHRQTISVRSDKTRFKKYYKLKIKKTETNLVF